MYSVRVATTNDRDFPPAEFSQGLGWERLTEIVRREVSPAAAAIFAEPIADPSGGAVHWHVESDDDPIAFSELTPQQQAEVTARLEQQRGAILALADRLASSVAEADVRLAESLRACVTVPDPARHIFSLAGRPLLVAWGRKAQFTQQRAARVTFRRPVEPAAPTPPRGLAGAARPQQGEARFVAPRIHVDWRGLFPYLLWPLFVALIMTLYYLLLPACALDLPVLRTIFDRCPGAAQSELDGLLDRNDALRAQLRDAQQRALRNRAECPREKKAESAPRSSDRFRGEGAPDLFIERQDRVAGGDLPGSRSLSCFVAPRGVARRNDCSLKLSAFWWKPPRRAGDDGARLLHRNRTS